MENVPGSRFQKTPNPYLTDNIKSDLTKAIASIEAKTPTTRGHYGEYMGLLTLAEFPKARELLADALIACGANAGGVQDALAIFKGS